MNFEVITYDYSLEEDQMPVTQTTTAIAKVISPPSSATISTGKRTRIMLTQQQTSAVKATKLSTPTNSHEKSKDETTVSFQNETNDSSVSLEATKDLLKRQIRSNVDERSKLVPEEFRRIQQSPFYRPDKSK
jgi:hypothetical protein